METTMSGMQDYSKTCKEKITRTSVCHMYCTIYYILYYTSMEEGPRSCVGVSEKERPRSCVGLGCSLFLPFLFFIFIYLFIFLYLELNG